MKKDLNKIFAGFSWRKYIPFWKKNPTPLVSFMSNKKLLYREYDSIFEEHGYEWFEIIKKLSMERTTDDDFKSMSDIEKSVIGADIFLSFMQQLRKEITILDSDNN